MLVAARGPANDLCVLMCFRLYLTCVDSPLFISQKAFPWWLLSCQCAYGNKDISSITDLVLLFSDTRKGPSFQDLRILWQFFFIWIWFQKNNKMHTKMYTCSWIFLHKYTDSAFYFDSLPVPDNSWSGLPLSHFHRKLFNLERAMGVRGGKKKKRRYTLWSLVGSRFFLMNPNPNYLFQKSLTKGVITNLDVNMHLDSHIYTLLLYIRIYFSKVLWENIIAIANEPGYENVCKYFQGANLEIDPVT